MNQSDRIPRPGRRLGRWLEAAVWVAVLGFAAYRLWPQAAAALGVGGSHHAATDFVVHTLDGRDVSLADLKGQVVLVNFWATWCPPCRVEMPGFQDVYNEKRDQGFTILGLSTDVTGAGAVAEFLRERGITYPVAMATRASIAAFGGTRGLPTSFLIDRQGRVRHQVVGIFAEPALRSAVEHLLAEDRSAARQRSKSSARSVPRLPISGT